MPRRPTAARRVGIAARWPLGMLITSWRYLWRITPVSRTQALGSAAADGPPDTPSGATHGELQPASAGVGPLYHRRYSGRIGDSEIAPEELMSQVMGEPNCAAPGALSNFSKVRGDQGRMDVGDEYVVRMPGPWDGPVRVMAVTPTAFRLATLEGHLEAGQIEFRAERQEDEIRFTIESWARSGSQMSDLLYSHAHMAKEIQFHMWLSFLEKVIKLSGGRRLGRLEVETRIVEETAISGEWRLLGAKPERALRKLAGRGLNYDPAGERSSEKGWRYDDFSQPLPPEPPGPPVSGASWETACRLSKNYAFADPAVIRATWDPERPLEDRDMLLEARVFGLTFHFGVRVGGVRDETVVEDGRQVRVWGWNYRTLEGHVEMGQMDYEVRKYLDTGEVEFRVFACWRRARARNPVIRLGFRIFGPARRQRFLRGTRQRMLELTTAELRAGGARLEGDRLAA